MVPVCPELFQGWRKRQKVDPCCTSEKCLGFKDEIIALSGKSEKKLITKTRNIKSTKVYLFHFRVFTLSCFRDE
jgi:hypothetical protein